MSDQISLCGIASGLNSNNYQGLLQQTGIALSSTICYGIGTIGSSYIARYQLSVLIALSSHLKVFSSQWEILPLLKLFLLLTKIRSMLVYDPILTSAENALLMQLGFTCLKHNEVSIVTTGMIFQNSCSWHPMTYYCPQPNLPSTVGDRLKSLLSSSCLTVGWPCTTTSSSPTGIPSISRARL